MSLVTQLSEGKITPATFVVESVADLKKDFQLFQSLPGAQNIEEWAIAALEAVATAKGISPTLSSLVAGEIEIALGLTPVANTTAS